MITFRQPHRVIVALACSWVACVSAALAASDKRRSAATSAPPAPAAVSPANTFDAFQLVVERNIFNPNRVGRTKATAEDKPPRIDEISLVGTMRSEKGDLAFFESPDPALRKTLRVGGTVGDFKVQGIAADGVELLRADQPLSLKVAQQLRRPEGGEWTVRATPPPLPGADSRAAGASGIFRPIEVPAVTEIPPDASDALKRLMEKRKKDLK